MLREFQKKPQKCHSISFKVRNKDVKYSEMKGLRKNQRIFLTVLWREFYQLSTEGGKNRNNNSGHKIGYKKSVKQINKEDARFINEKKSKSGSQQGR